ncbi:hypothetical protein GGP41_005710 [Bipolaris sorokiniana]|uniref:Uncharacterized protein n=2 Tax=Cochliobolus sativus TaxID=45130 RepID=A0A8H5ZIA0_COCSA|nr:uncharacterized protein COCSADRAFT_37417 [Bipolaris sorokiniana ND90Pr]EMD63645.1 hypothetical protein COCSADRAFT_37417 [Bipolaris sorokiniana ND90Pr]KAF5848308.1 hypothetical protein GGP41_005710 [Bipolaris sorokiniana]
MNYASWIEEKKLKKTFIVATLASTLVGTFTASLGLWERIADRRAQHRQKQRDIKQDSEIKELRMQFEEAQQKAEKRQEEIDRLRNGRGRDDVGSNFERDMMMVQRMYDQGYGRIGSRFAQGDPIIENQLQAQIIALQQTVISVLQDALYSDRQLTRTDMAKLINASNEARENSLEALRQAQQRLGGSQVSNGSHRSASPLRSLPPPQRASSAVLDGPEQLFCPYALDIQRIQNKPLAASFAPGGSCICPACGLQLDVTSEDFWMIGKRTPITVWDKTTGYESEVFDTREFRLAQRFVVQCHTPDGEYACTICSKGQDVDAICRTVESLVKHVGTYHDAAELEREPDLREVKVETKRLSLPAPPPLSSDPRPLLREEVIYR